jgi:hypothetical protein
MKRCFPNSSIDRVRSPVALALLLVTAILLVGCADEDDSNAALKLDGTPPPPGSSPLPTVSLLANPTTVNSGDSSTLTWSSSDAISCNAGGAWSGNKPISGNQSTGALTQTSTFTLTCTGPGGSTNVPRTVAVQGGATGSADLSWIPPVTNEDGTPVNLTGFKVYTGPSASNLQPIATLGVGQTTYTATNLSPGTHYFAVTAMSSTAESVFSNVGSKTTF